METYWPLHTPLKREILTLQAGNSSVLEGHRVRKCAFWKKFLPQLGNAFLGGSDTKDDRDTDTLLCATTKDILPVRQDMMVLHTAAFVLFCIAFVLLVVKISFMVASIVIKACSHQRRPPVSQRSEMTHIVSSSY